MPGKKLVALFIAAFAVTLALTAPASLLGALLSSQTHGAIELTSPEGTIWRGSAIPVFHAPHGNPVPLQQISWNVSPLPLFYGKIGLHVSEGRAPQAQATEIVAGFSGVELRHVSFEVPAAVLEAIHPLLQALHPGGQLQVSSDQLTIAGSSLQGSATAKWLSASSAISIVNPFGSYQINLNGTGGKVTLGLATLAGPLLLDGQGEWSYGKGLSIEAHAKASAENQEALAELLHHMGPEISPGTHLIKIGSII